MLNLVFVLRVKAAGGTRAYEFTNAVEWPYVPRVGDGVEVILPWTDAAAVKSVERRIDDGAVRVDLEDVELPFEEDLEVAVRGLEAHGWCRVSETS